MSARNLFVIKARGKADTKRIYNALGERMNSIEFSIVFEPKRYWDEIVSLIECSGDFFTITENATFIECEGVFSIEDAFKYASTFPKRHYKEKEREYLHDKWSFFNDIVQIIFSDPHVEALEYYLSDQYSTELDDFKYCIQVADGKLTEALIDTYEPTKKEKYFGLKTVKFIIER